MVTLSWCFWNVVIILNISYIIINELQTFHYFSLIWLVDVFILFCLLTSDIKFLLNEKKRAFRRGDREELKRVQRELKVMITATGRVETPAEQHKRGLDWDEEYYWLQEVR